MGQPLASHQDATGHVHTNHSPNPNGHIALDRNNVGPLCHEENQDRRHCQNNAATSLTKDNEDYERAARLMEENKELRKLLIECYQVQRASHKLKLSIFDERLQKRVEAAIASK